MQRLIFDRKSYTPAGFVRSAVFIGKEYLHRRRDASFRADFVEDDERKKQALAYGEVLRSDGILLLPSYFQGEFLRKLQMALHDAVRIFRRAAWTMRGVTKTPSVPAPQFLRQRWMISCSRLSATIMENRSD